MSDFRDPFGEGDPRAAEREARRRQREEKRRRRSAGARRSLADRVSGVLGGGTAAQPQPPGQEQPEAPAPAEPPDPPPEPRVRAPQVAPTPAPAEPPRSPPPQEPRPIEAPAARPASGLDDDWLSELDRKVETGEWLLDGDAHAASPSPPSTETHRAAAPAPIRPAAPTPNPEPAPAPLVRPQPEPETGSHTDEWETHGAVPQARDGGGSDDGGGTPVVGSGPPSGERQKWTRRLVALGVLLVALGAVVLVAQQLFGDEAPPPVAKGPKKLKTFSVVIPEGLTIAQMADVAKEAGVKGDYEAAVEKAARKFPFQRYDADTSSLEGFLFPATYDLVKDAPAEDLVAKQLEAFELNFGEIDMKQAAKKNLTPYDVLTIASLIEEEVQVDKERPLVAAVIYNRLAAGDTLGIDATLRYELEKYNGQLLASELEADTPYNTRVNSGLPPTPIANPGLASMEAAAAPADSDAYYFVVKPGTCGEHFFTADSAEFEQAAAEYQAALEAEGGSPTEC